MRGGAVGSSLGSISQNQMNTKQIGDIAEQSVILQALKLGWGVCKPVGDRLPYDLVFDVNGNLIKIQVKSAWLDSRTQNYIVDSRRTKTNRRVMLRTTYNHNDFDFAIVSIEALQMFYVIPVEVFTGYKSAIHFVEADRRQRKPQSSEYREAWHLILQWAAQLVTTE